MGSLAPPPCQPPPVGLACCETAKLRSLACVEEIVRLSSGPRLPGPAGAAGRGAARAGDRGPSIPDVELTDQDGRPVHVYSDLIRGRRVAMNFVFTTCTTICPPMGANFERLQKGSARAPAMPAMMCG